GGPRQERLSGVAVPLAPEAGSGAGSGRPASIRKHGARTSGMKRRGVMSLRRDGARRGLSVLMVVGVLGFAEAVRGQDDPASRAAGTAAEFVLAVPALAAVPEGGGNAGEATTVNFERYCVSNGCGLVAPLMLPSGALVIGVGVEAVDTST